MTGFIRNYGVAFPSLRLAADAYREAWGGCSARGLRRKPFCAYDEDPITLAIAAARRALDGVDLEDRPIGALFVGSTNLPYAEKPSSATIVSALLGAPSVRTVEITGSRQAGLQALLLASEYVAAHPEKSALAIAADAPFAAPDAPFEHALSAAAAAFVVDAQGGVASIGADISVTVETFGSRFRRNGQTQLSDLELRVDDDAASLDACARLGAFAKPDRLAIGAAGPIAARAVKLFGGAEDGLWPNLGDAGAASAGVALAHCLNAGQAGERILALATGGGATALELTLTDAGRDTGRTLIDQLAAGTEVDYLSYLKHKRILSSRAGHAA